MKNVNTNEAKLDLAQKFLDYANCTNASYAMSFCMFFLICLNGCSSQYDDFQRLCEKEDSQTIIHNEYYWDIFYNRIQGNTEHDENGEYYYNKELDKKIYFDYRKAKDVNVSQKQIGKITDNTFESYYDNIHYATRHIYSYDHKGIFIGGDEGKGFYLYYEKTEYCK